MLLYTVDAETKNSQPPVYHRKVQLRMFHWSILSREFESRSFFKLLSQYWRNPQLTWDPNKYGGIKEIHVSPSDIWVPDILLYNK